jgi:hypothetical protein
MWKQKPILKIVIYIVKVHFTKLHNRNDVTNKCLAAFGKFG